MVWIFTHPLESIAGFAALVAVLLVVCKVPIGYNLRNLVVRWRITALTALAFTVVIALLIVMLAFVNGMYSLTEGSGQPGNVIVLSDGATDELFSNLAFGDTNDVEHKVAPKLRQAIARDEGGRLLVSRETYIVANQPVPTAPDEPTRRRFIQIRGMDDAAVGGRVHNLPLLEGKWFTDRGVRALPAEGESAKAGPKTAIEAVLGDGLARQLGKDRGKERLDIGDVFELGPNPDVKDLRVQKWVVVGVLRSAGSTFDSEVWAKRDNVGKMFGKLDYTTIVLRTKDARAAREVAYDLSHQTPPLGAKTEPEYYDKLSETNRQFLWAIIIVAIIMAIGGIFGVMNTMFAAISSRTKDIGVLRILGFARWQILVSFFLESLAIAIVGGLLGCALGYLADGWSATSIVSSGMGGGKSVMLKLVVDLNILGVGMLLALLMGTLGGLVPALSAMRLRPLESLR
jgi:ABC-type lipoprotein release transport system permease subunit